MRTLVLQANFSCWGCGCESQPTPSFWKLHRIFRTLTSSFVCDNDLQPWNLWKQWAPARSSSTCNKLFVAKNDTIWCTTIRPCIQPGGYWSRWKDYRRTSSPAFPKLATSKRCVDNTLLKLTLFAKHPSCGNMPSRRFTWLLQSWMTQKRLVIETL